MWDAVRQLSDSGVTILLTTQYLDEADRLAGSVAVLDRGQVVAEGTPAELKARIGGGHVRLRFADLHLVASARSVLRHAEPDDEDQLVLRVPADNSVEVLRTVLDDLHQAGIGVEDISIHTPDLDDVFLAVTAHHVTASHGADNPLADNPLADKTASSEKAGERPASKGATRR